MLPALTMPFRKDICGMEAATAGSSHKKQAFCKVSGCEGSVRDSG